MDKCKILVVSDSHGNTTKLDRIIKKELPFQYLIHCGDGVNDLIHVDIPADVAVVRVMGNVDLHRSFGIDRILNADISGKRFLVTHGDRFNVRNGFDSLIRQGIETSSDIILFGHTHISYHAGGSPVLFNPGTVTKGSYGLIYIGAGITFSHERLEG